MKENHKQTGQLSAFEACVLSKMKLVKDRITLTKLWNLCKDEFRGMTQKNFKKFVQHNKLLNSNFEMHDQRQRINARVSFFQSKIPSAEKLPTVQIHDADTPPVIFEKMITLSKFEILAAKASANKISSALEKVESTQCRDKLIKLINSQLKQLQIRKKILNSMNALLSFTESTHE